MSGGWHDPARRMMHGVPWLFKRVHAKHHLHRDVRAREIFRLSVVEEVAAGGPARP